jgi:hypothetical protein
VALTCARESIAHKSGITLAFKGAWRVQTFCPEVATGRRISGLAFIQIFAKLLAI